MSQDEINEIRTAIATIHHLTDDYPLTGWKYMMLKAVLPLLERAREYEETYIYTDTPLQDHSDALEIARVVNYKRPNTTDVSGLDVTPKDIDVKPWKGVAKQETTLNKSTLKRLQAEGRITEKPQTPIVVRRNGVDYLSSKEIEEWRIKEKK